MCRRRSAGGTQAKATGDYDHAAGLYRAGLSMAEELGLWPQAADQLSWLGRIKALTGDHAQARAPHQRAMRLAADHGDKPGADFAEIELGEAARREGDLDAAERHLRRVLEQIHQTGLEAGAADAIVLAQLGFVADSAAAQKPPGPSTSTATPPPASSATPALSRSPWKAWPEPKPWPGTTNTRPACWERRRQPGSPQERHSHQKNAPTWTGSPPERGPPSVRRASPPP